MLKKILDIRMYMFLLGFVLINLISTNIFAKSTDDSIKETAREVFNYSYPLVLVGKTMELSTNVSTPDSMGKAPVGQIGHFRKYIDASFKDIVSPNYDTLYSWIWLDLSKDSYAISIPAIKNRYFLVPIIDAWTNVFFSKGSRTGNTNGLKLLVVSRNFKGKAPVGYTLVKSPTDVAWVMIRIQSKATPEDYKIVNGLQDQIKAIPLSSLNNPNYTAPKESIDKAVDMKTAPTDKIAKMTAVEYYTLFAKLLKNNPPYSYDKKMLSKMAKLGIVPGKDFDSSKVNPKVLKIMEDNQSLFYEGIIGYAHDNKVTFPINKIWSFVYNPANFGNNYNARTLVARVGFGANLEKDAIYFGTKASGPLKGNLNYVIHFDKKDLPKVYGFWSVTLYNQSQSFIDNKLNRYFVGTNSADGLKYNKDGSLDIYVQSKNPGKDKESNWLPTSAKEDFNLIARFYGPSKEILTKKWIMPELQIVK